MGLSLQLGALSLADDWHARQLRVVNRVLGAAGLPAHEEPAEQPPLCSRAGSVGFPYSFIHHLRRLYAHCKSDPTADVEPVADGEDPAEDALVEELGHDLSSHLICHSDSSGFYVPVRFGDVLTDDELAGGCLGSSLRLLEELSLCAPALGIYLSRTGSLSDAEVERINAAASKNGAFCRELTAWIALWEAARLSVAHGISIELC